MYIASLNRYAYVRIFIERFQMSVVKPITTGTDNAMNQSELKANAANWRQARENACEQVTIGYSFASDWLKKWHEIFFGQSQHSNAKSK